MVRKYWTTSDAAGNELWREEYTPYGEKYKSNAANDDLGGYTGHVYDSATGLNYMQARYHDPVIGRFLSIDPVGFSEAKPYSFNRYSYVGNNPFAGTDPTGMVDNAGDEEEEKEEKEKEEEVIVYGSTGSSRPGSQIMSTVSLGADSATLALQSSVGSVGITSKGSLRYYSNGWKGNGTMSTTNLPQLGAQFGYGLAIMNVGINLRKAYAKEITAGELAANVTLITAAVLSRSVALVGLGMAITNNGGDKAMAKAMDILVEMQAPSINNSMNFQ